MIDRVIVMPELAFLSQHVQRGGGECLGVGGDGEQGMCIDRRLAQRSLAPAALEHDFAVLGHRDRCLRPIEGLAHGFDMGIEIRDMGRHGGHWRGYGLAGLCRVAESTGHDQRSSIALIGT